MTDATFIKAESLPARSDGPPLASAAPSGGREPHAVGERGGLVAWLTSDRPMSRRQAGLGRAYQGWRNFARNRLALVGLFIVLALVLVAIFADQLAPYSAYVGDLRTTRLLPPSWAHWMGTDDQGRDILSRLIHGSRITLFVVV
ncbi:MAG: binding-protein-dependent transport system inner rane component, partial [Polaromonas sp.]|nr:binding-protein-dependent transport system inner rane component [Polaromonas sp.]